MDDKYFRDVRELLKLAYSDTGADTRTTAIRLLAGRIASTGRRSQIDTLALMIVLAAPAYMQGVEGEGRYELFEILRDTLEQARQDEERLKTASREAMNKFAGELGKRLPQWKSRDEGDGE